MTIPAQIPAAAPVAAPGRPRLLANVAALALPAILALAAADPAPPRITVFPAPGGDVAPSPNYAVTLRAGGTVLVPFVYESHSRTVEKAVDDEGRYTKVPFLGLHSMPVTRVADQNDTYAHSWVCFDADFAAGPVEVEVRITTPGDGLSLPLRSAAVLPSALGVEAKVDGPTTVRFTLARPAKLALVPNAREAFAAAAGEGPKRALEGYRNPLFVFARAPEVDVPDKAAPGTLVVRPGDPLTPEQVAGCTVLWFEPGVHEYARFNPADPDHYLVLAKGQTVYLAGGAYLYGHFRSAVFRPLTDMPLLRGRGTLSDLRNRWSSIPWRDTPAKSIRLAGITVTDRHNHLTGSAAPMRDVAAVGAWHGNADGPALHVPPDDPYTGWHSDDCFVMAADTNLLVNGRARARNYTVWQLANAESVWVKREVDGSLIDGLQVIAHHRWGERGQVFNCMGTGTAAKRHLVVRNVTIEAPFVPMLFRMTADFGGEGEAFRDVLFENITVRTAGIAAKSPFGGGRPGSVGRVTFRNLVINGTRVTAANCRDYFDLAPGIAPGRELVFE